MNISSDNAPTQVHDKHFKITCPHCQTPSNITAISIPRHEFVTRFQLQKVGVCHMCNNCKQSVFLRFKVTGIGNPVVIDEDSAEEVEFPKENFELQYLPPEVAEDFSEALTCYSNRSYNAFGAMCRRTIQSAFMQLGATGKDRVIQQLKEVRSYAVEGRQ